MLDSEDAATMGQLAALKMRKVNPDYHIVHGDWMKPTVETWTRPSTPLNGFVELLCNKLGRHSLPGKV